MYVGCFLSTTPFFLPNLYRVFFILFIYSKGWHKGHKEGLLYVWKKRCLTLRDLGTICVFHLMSLYCYNEEQTPVQFQIHCGHIAIVVAHTCHKEASL